MKGVITYLDRVERRCWKCGKPVNTTARNLRYCKDCREPIRRERDRSAARKQYRKQKAARHV